MIYDILKKTGVQIMFVVVNGKTYKATKTDACDERYTEYNVTLDGELVGIVTKYGDEIYYTARRINGEIITERKTVRETVEVIAGQ